MILIICNPHDGVASAVYQQLKQHNVLVQFITASDLVFAPYWRHEVSDTGIATTEIRLLNGTVIHSSEVTAVFNRLRYLEAVHFIDPTDKAYAEMEFLALFFSFIKSLEHALVLPLKTWHLSSEGIHELQIKAAAIAAGLPVLDMHFTTSPRWIKSEGMIPMSPTRVSKGTFYKKSPHMIWGNQPVLFLQYSKTIIKVLVAGMKVLCERTLPFETSLLFLAENLGSLCMEILISESEDGRYCLYEVDLSPNHISPAAVSAIAETLIQKTLQSV